ncbi:hypothetical protein [Paraburkholderia piptadeniae]|uniref:hypothetical protein n=1 Tax=Paraburkholderia piptadeniae TaxID=1701573 RepID=UPI0011806EC1
MTAGVTNNVGVAPISEINKVDSHDTFERLIYADNSIVTVQVNEPVKVVTLGAASFGRVFTKGGRKPSPWLAEAKCLKSIRLFDFDR